MANFRKGTWKLRENIRCVGGEIITDIKTHFNTQKSYECNLPKSDARASFYWS